MGLLSKLQVAPKGHAVDDDTHVYEPPADQERPWYGYRDSGDVDYVKAYPDRSNEHYERNDFGLQGEPPDDHLQGVDAPDPAQGRPWRTARWWRPLSRDPQYADGGDGAIMDTSMAHGKAVAAPPQGSYPRGYMQAQRLRANITRPSYFSFGDVIDANMPGAMPDPVMDYSYAAFPSTY